MRSLFTLAAIVVVAAADASQNLTAALSGQSNLSNLTALVSQYPTLLSALNSATNVTILAPSNDALSAFINSTSSSALNNTALVQAILSYHVLNGTYNSSNITTTPTFIPTHLTSQLLANVTGGQRVEALNNSGTVTFISGLLKESNVTTADIAYNNGIIHIINAVLTAPVDISDTADDFNLTSVYGALEATDLVDTIDDASDLTVFVPNNDAFAAIASVVTNASMATIADVLKYHVVNGSVLYSPMITNTTLTSFGGQNLTVSVINGTVYVNQAKVVLPNVLVANGVVHVIDSVLNPNNTSASAGSNATAFSGASSASNVPFTSGVPTPSTSATVPAVVASTTASSSTGNGAVARGMTLPTGLVGGAVMFAGALIAL